LSNALLEKENEGGCSACLQEMGGVGGVVWVPESLNLNESLLASTKRWNYLLAGQTECKILLKLKRRAEIHDLSNTRPGGL